MWHPYYTKLCNMEALLRHPYVIGDARQNRRNTGILDWRSRPDTMSRRKGSIVVGTVRTNKTRYAETETNARRQRPVRGPQYDHVGAEASENGGE